MASYPDEETAMRLASEQDRAPTGEQIAAEAWKRFEEWCRKYDPEGNMDSLDLANAYDVANGLATDPDAAYEAKMEGR